MDDHIDEAITHAAVSIRKHYPSFDRISADGIAAWLAEDGLLVTPAHDAAVAAKAWDEGYAVGEDNFIHSDYCGMRGCQCQGLHGTTNPYLTKEADDV